jgi:hypothetical protein
MEFYCEDLPLHGVVLIPPSPPDYDSLLADIQRRIDHPVAGSPPIPESMQARISAEDRETSAILLNHSQNGIAAIQQVWTFQETTGRTYTSSIGSGSNPSVLLPFGVLEKFLKIYGYWHVILPGSKLYLNANGEQVGDNTDVRPPAPDELWTGGFAGGRAGGSRRRGPFAKITLTLDGVFFSYGGFAGPNRKGLWEQVVSRAEAHLQVSNTARQNHDKGVAADRILAQIETITGPASDRLLIPPPPSGSTNPEQYVSVR